MLKINKIKLEGFGFILPLFAVVIMGLTSLPTSALTYEDTVVLQFTWNPSISINVSGDLLIPNLTPGSSSDSNIITITAGSNDANGYTLYSNVGNSTSNYTDLRISPSNSTNKFTNLSSNKANLAAFADNTWGYSYCNATSNASACDTTSNWVSGSVGSTSAGYNGLPLYNSSNNATGIILADTTTANQTTLKFKIGAKAATSQASGLYTNVVNFTSVAKVVTTSYTLSYVDNSSEATGMPSSSTTGTTTNGAFNVTSTVPSRTNYTFKGWCTTNNSSDSTTCSGTLIQPGGIYAIGSSPATFTGSVYAVWGSTTSEVTIATATNMQDVTSCPSSLPTGQNYTIKDSRDGQDYTVAKLADGKCWMTTNLNLAGGARLSYEDTDFDNTYTLPTTNGWAVDNGKLVLPASDNSSSSFSTNNYAYVYNSTSTDCASNTGCYGYYSWDTVTLGSGRTISTDNTNAPYSICPKGWKIPASRTTSATNWRTESDFYMLAHHYGLDSTTQTYESDNGFYTQAGPGTTPSFLLAGMYYSGSFYYGNSVGFYWSSTSNSSGYSYYLSFQSSNVNSTNTDEGRVVGFSVRCVYGG